MRLPAVSKHLRVLEKAGLLTRGHETQYRPCTLNGPPLKEADEWIERYRRFWEQSFDRLDAYLRDLQGAAERRKDDVQGAAGERKDDVQKHKRERRQCRKKKLDQESLEDRGEPDSGKS